MVGFNSRKKWTGPPDMSNLTPEERRRDIEAQVAQFLASGGSIKDFGNDHTNNASYRNRARDRQSWLNKR